jgi:hypothetical protein
MPKINLEIGDTYKSVVRPACLDVVEQMKAYTGIPKDTKVLFNDETNRVTNQDNVSFGKDDRLRVKATALYTEQGMLNMAVGGAHNVPIFHDPVLGVVAEPVYGETKLELEVEYRAKDRPTAEQWLNTIKRKVATGTEENLHSITYHYLLPEALMVVLYEVHRLRELQAGYGETLRSYFSQYMDSRVTKVTDQAGGNPRAAVREQQVQILGYFNFEAVPELDKEEGGATWIASFNYTVEFDRILGMNVTYPMIVHNQPMGTDFVNWDNDFNELMKELIFSATTHGLEVLNDSIPAMSTLEGWAVPDCDEWYPTAKRDGACMVARVLIGLDPRNTSLLLNLSELDTITLAPEALEYCKNNYDKLHLPLASPIFVTLYQDNMPMGEDLVMVDTYLNVSSSVPLDLRKTYHLVISVATDLTRLTEKTIEWLLCNGEFTVWLLSALLDETHHDKIPKLMDGQDGAKIMPRKKFFEVIRYIKDTHIGYKNNVNVSNFRVGYYTINTNN